MKKEIRNELQELAVILQGLQNYCNKYYDNSLDDEISYYHKRNKPKSTTQIDVTTLDTPSKIKDFLQGVSEYVEEIYYR